MTSSALLRKAENAGHVSSIGKVVARARARTPSRGVARKRAAFAFPPPIGDNGFVRVHSAV